MITLTLPQWSALSAIPLNALSSVNLVSDGVTEVGLPVWQAPFINFPVVGIPDGGQRRGCGCNVLGAQ